VTDYPTVADILTIHHDLIDRHGGSHGMRDPGQIEAILFRSQTGHDPDLIAEVAVQSTEADNWHGP